MSLKQNIFAVKSQIDAASQNNQKVSLLAVSKTKPISQIKEAYDLGLRDFGENYVQEAISKIDYFKANHADFNICWHLIGPLQSNKCKDVANRFDWVQSLDRVKIAHKLNEFRSNQLPPLNVLIQVNISHEASKSGIYSDDVLTFASEISHLPNLKLRGLMTIAHNTRDEATLKNEFMKMQELFTLLKEKYPNVDTLSMGMSQDIALAIYCGSNMVRVGTALFGERSY